MTPIRRIVGAALAASCLLLVACSDDAGDEADTPAPSIAGDPSITGSTPTVDTPTAGPVGSRGCGTPADVEPVTADLPGDHEQTLTVAGVPRTYRLAVAADHDPDVAVPLVLNLHGSGSNGLQAGVYSNLPHEATDRGMIVAAPDAVAGAWELGGDGADADFLAALIDDLEGRYCIDPDRVHLVGFSLGAWKAAVTACTLNGRIASVALLTVEVFPGECAPLPVVAFHGTADTTVAYGPGGEAVVDPASPNAGLPGALENITAWAESGGCDPEPAITRIGSDVELRAHTGCDDGIDVALYTIEGGGHTWPGTDVVIGPPELTTDTIDATALLLDWFEDHPRAS